MKGLNPRPKTEVSKTAKNVLAKASDMDSVFLPLGDTRLFPSNSKELEVFIAIFLKCSISNHFGRNFIQTMNFSFSFALA